MAVFVWVRYSAVRVFLYVAAYVRKAARARRTWNVSIDANIARGHIDQVRRIENSHSTPDFSLSLALSFAENHAMHQRIELPVRLPEQRQMAPRLEPLPPPARDHEIVEYHHVPAPSRNHNSIFTLLFERPARRRAYRQLNRNATNLVRRLSQSRLFLNSSRAQRNRPPDSAAQTPVTPTTAEPWFDASITPDNVPTLHSASSLPSIDRESNAVPSAPVHTSADDDVFASEPSLCQRAETPPPAYQDILPNLSLSRQSLSHRHSF